ncbi:MAG: hypothetical protein Q9186_004312 [Xanthomendoza sp. 1 TL-2023]
MKKIGVHQRTKLRAPTYASRLNVSSGIRKPDSHEEIAGTDSNGEDGWAFNVWLILLGRSNIRKGESSNRGAPKLGRKVMDPGKTLEKLGSRQTRYRCPRGTDEEKRGDSQLCKDTPLHERIHEIYKGQDDQDRASGDGYKIGRWEDEAAAWMVEKKNIQGRDQMRLMTVRNDSLGGVENIEERERRHAMEEVVHRYFGPMVPKGPRMVASGSGVRSGKRRAFAAVESCYKGYHDGM